MKAKGTAARLSLFLFQTHRAAMTNAPCRDGKRTVPRWLARHVAFSRASEEVSEDMLLLFVQTNEIGSDGNRDDTQDRHYYQRGDCEGQKDRCQNRQNGCKDRDRKTSRKHLHTILPQRQAYRPSGMNNCIIRKTSITMIWMMKMASGEKPSLSAKYANGSNISIGNKPLTN